MNQLKEGLFAVEEQMPCSPKDITVLRYALPSTLDRYEREEAAARILCFSQQLDQWVGVSWQVLASVMKEEYQIYESINEAKHHNFDERLRCQREMQKYLFFCALTLGVYALFASKPAMHERKVPCGEIPFSGIFVCGPEHVATGIHELIENGFLRRVTEGEGENALDILFPTPALVSRIMQKQGVAPG